MSIDWDGKGLPPVGLEVQARFTTDDNPKWENVVFTHIGFKFIALRYHDGDFTETEVGNKALEVRPIVTSGMQLAKVLISLSGDIRQPINPSQGAWMAAQLEELGYRKFEIVEDDV